MAVPQTTSRAEWAQLYANNPQNGFTKAEEQHANLIKPVWTAGVEGGHAVTQALQVTDDDGDAVAESFDVVIEVAAGVTVTTLTDGGAGTLVETYTAGRLAKFRTDVNGALAVTVTHNATAEVGIILIAHVAGACAEAIHGNRLKFNMD